MSFVTVRIADNEGNTAPRADNLLKFTIEGPGEIVATDNGDPTNFVPFPSHERQAFNGLCLVIVRAIPGQKGAIKLKAESESLESAALSIRSTPKP